MRSYYAETTNTGLRILISDSNDEYVGYEDSSDAFALSLVVGFAIFLICII